MDSGTIEGAGTFIYCISTKRYLFLLRDGCKYSGSWGLAGGRVENLENIIDSLRRELQEEIGFDFTGMQVIPIEKFTSDNGNFFYHTFFVPVMSEFVPILNHEHRGYCWVHLEDYPKPLHPGVWRTINFEAVVGKIKTIEKFLETSL